MVRLTCWAKKRNFNRNFVGFVQGSWKCKQATAKERRSVWNGSNLSHMQELWDNCWAKLGYSCCITIRGFFGEVWRGFIFWCRCLFLRICWWDFFFIYNRNSFHYIYFNLFYCLLRVMARSFFYFRVAIWDARKACRAYYSVALWLCAGALGEHLSPRFARRAVRRLHPHVHFSHTGNPRRCSLEWALVRTTKFLGRYIRKFGIILLYICIY